MNLFNGKRVLCTVVCLLLILGSIPATSAEADMSKTLEITWLGWNVAGMLPKDGSITQKLIEEKFNVVIKNVPVDTYNVEQLNIMLATGLDFDVQTSADNIMSYVDQGLVRSIDEDLIKTYLPFAYNALEEYAPDVWRQLVSKDGKIYGVPAIRYSNMLPHVLGVRKDWMEAVGVTEIPKTIEELESLLLKLSNDDPDGNGKKDTYALTKMDYYCDYLFGAYGVSNQGWIVGENGEPVNPVIQTGYKEALKILQRWYKLGIFDPECISETRKTCIAKFIAGSIAGYSGNYWAFAMGHNNSPVENARRNGTEIEMVLIPPVTGPEGLSGTLNYGDSVAPEGLIFGRNCSDEKMIRILQILNAEFTDLQLYAKINYGAEDVDWKFDEDGYVAYLDPLSNEDIHEMGLARFLFNDFWCKDLVKVRQTKDFAKVDLATSEWPRVVRHQLTAFTTEADLEHQAAVDTITQEFFLKALVGEIDVDTEWEAYVSRWLSAGGQDMIDAKLKLYETLNK